MRKTLILLFLIMLSVQPFQKANAMDAKGKAFLIICTYGTVGGALLGFASMAFGTNSRAIAQGASLGLYAGIGFGAYVISSHRRSMEPVAEPGYEQQPPPPGYGPPGGGAFGQDPAGGGGFAPPPEEGGFFGAPQRYIEIQNDLVFNYKLKEKQGRNSIPVYIPIFNAVF